MKKLSKKYSVILLLISVLLASPSFAFGRKGRGASFKAAFGMKLNAKDVVALVQRLETAKKPRVAAARQIQLSKSVTRAAIAEVLKTGEGTEITLTDDEWAAKLETGLTVGMVTIISQANGFITIFVPYNYYGIYF